MYIQLSRYLQFCKLNSGYTCITLIPCNGTLKLANNKCKFQDVNQSLAMQPVFIQLCKCYEASAYLETAPGQYCSVSPFGASLEICVSVMRPVLTLRQPLDNVVLFLLSQPLQRFVQDLQVVVLAVQFQLQELQPAAELHFLLFDSLHLALGTWVMLKSNTE